MVDKESLGSEEDGDQHSTTQSKAISIKIDENSNYRINDSSSRMIDVELENSKGSELRLKDDDWNILRDNVLNQNQR